MLRLRVVSIPQAHTVVRRDNPVSSHARHFSRPSQGPVSSCTTDKKKYTSSFKYLCDIYSEKLIELCPQLSIYPSPQPEIILLDTPSELEKHIGNVRRTVTGVYTDAHARVQGVVSRWIGVEHAVESAYLPFCALCYRSELTFPCARTGKIPSCTRRATHARDPLRRRSNFNRFNNIPQSYPTYASLPTSFVLSLNTQPLPPKDIT